MERCLFHTESNNVVGFCRHHNCAVTVKQMKNKNCLQKGCRYFVKNENHEYWRQKALAKKNRKNRKQMLEDRIAKIYGGM